MFTEPKIVTSNDLTKRSYVTFYLSATRIREYNGKRLGLRLDPNRAATLEERVRLLEKLKYELHKALDTGSYNVHQIVGQDHSDETFKPLKATIAESLDLALQSKLKGGLSKKYKRNLVVIHRQFKEFLSPTELREPLTALTTRRLDEFLRGFGSTGTYYMNKRRDLSVLLKSAGKHTGSIITSVDGTARQRAKASLHRPYEVDQLQPVLKYIKTRNFKLYVCCLMTYGTWLRPHEEIRLLKVSDINLENREIVLDGYSNKGGKVRKVFIPDYLLPELTTLLEGKQNDSNIFTGVSEPLNEYYFSTQWKRIAMELKVEDLIYPKQTIYSFRHTAAIQLYKRTKDVYLLQKLLGHSNIVVTLKYLRSLGEFNSEELRDAAPTL